MPAPPRTPLRALCPRDLGNRRPVAWRTPMHDPAHPDSDQSLSLLLRLDEACSRFEAAWKAGQRPRIEEYLAETPDPEHPIFLAELLALEVAYRRRSGE